MPTGELNLALCPLEIARARRLHAKSVWLLALLRRRTGGPIMLEMPCQPLDVAFVQNSSSWLALSLPHPHPMDELWAYGRDTGETEESHKSPGIGRGADSKDKSPRKRHRCETILTSATKQECGIDIDYVAVASQRALLQSVFSACHRPLIILR